MKRRLAKPARVQKKGRPFALFQRTIPSALPSWPVNFLCGKISNEIGMERVRATRAHPNISRRMRTRVVYVKDVKTANLIEAGRLLDGYFERDHMWLL